MEVVMKKLLRVLAILFAVLQVGFFAGCSSSGKIANYNASVNGASKSAAATASGSLPKSSDIAQATISRKIIMSANISLQTNTYNKTVTGIETLVAQYGGFVQDSLVEGTGKAGSVRTASYTVRVPSVKLDDFLSDVGKTGNLLSKKVTGQDVTQQYFDTQTQLDSLNTEEARILEILGKTQNMTDMITVEQRLTDVENQINQLTGELQKWDSLVDLSTVNISITEDKSAAVASVGFGNQVSAVLSGSLKALLTTLRVIMIVIIAILPFVVFFGIIALAIILIVRHRRKHRKSGGK
jgi:hypothetical protein